MEVINHDVVLLTVTVVTVRCDWCSQLQGALNGRDREISSLRRQLDACQEELAALRKEKQVIIKENKRLQDDLSTMTRENQVCLSRSEETSVISSRCVLCLKAVHVEMEDALHQRDELKMRLHSYITEVSRTEKLIATKARGNTFFCFFVLG